MRPPVFAGVTEGVGTSTLALALHGVDGGRYDGRPVDVLVCRADTGSLIRAAATPGAPVLAIMASAPVPGVPARRDALSDSARAWIDRLRPRSGAVVVLPFVGRWSRLDRPAPEVAGLLAGPAERRSPYATALVAIAEELLRQGALAQPGVRVPAPSPPPPRCSPTPPFPRVISRASVPVVVRLDAGGRAGGAVRTARSLWRGLEPVERRGDPGAVPELHRADLDDDALETRPARTG